MYFSIKTKNQHKDFKKLQNALPQCNRPSYCIFVYQLIRDMFCVIFSLKTNYAICSVVHLKEEYGGMRQNVFINKEKG